MGIDSVQEMLYFKSLKNTVPWIISIATHHHQNTTEFNSGLLYNAEFWLRDCPCSGTHGRFRLQTDALVTFQTSKNLKSFNTARNIQLSML
jgi:hypothetical protein